MKLNLGCGTDLKEGFLNIDKNLEYNPKFEMMEFNLDKSPWPISTDSVEFVWAHHILEHLTDLTEVMWQLHRVCKNNAEIDIVVPIAHSLWDVANPDHKHRFNHKTFECYSVDHKFSDNSLFQGFKIVSQHVEREPDEWFETTQWVVANLHVILRNVK